MGVAVPLFNTGCGAAAADVEGVSPSSFSPGGTSRPSGSAASPGGDVRPAVGSGEFVLEFGRVGRNPPEVARQLAAAGSRGPRGAEEVAQGAAASPRSEAAADTKPAGARPACNVTVLVPHSKGAYCCLDISVIT